MVRVQQVSDYPTSSLPRSFSSLGTTAPKDSWVATCPRNDIPDTDAAVPATRIPLIVPVAHAGTLPEFALADG